MVFGAEYNNVCDPETVIEELEQDFSVCRRADTVNCTVRNCVTKKKACRQSAGEGVLRAVRGARAFVQRPTAAVQVPCGAGRRGEGQGRARAQPLAVPARRGST